MPDPKTYTQEEYDAMIAERDALKANRDAALTEAKQAKKKLQDYEGVDPGEYKALKEAAAEAERKKALAEGNLEVWKKQVTDAHQREMQAKDAREAKLLKALESRKVARLTDALAKAEALPEFMDLLTLKGAAAVRLREGESDWEEYIADAQGNPLVADGAGSPMTMQQFVEKQLKAQYPAAFKGTGSSGGGASRSTTGGGGQQRNIAANDGAAFMRNLTDIAKGDITVPVLDAD